MTAKLWIAAAAFVFASAPVIAQDLPTNQLDMHADTVRQGILVRKTVGRNAGGQSARGASTRQAQACANRARFAREYGSDHPKVRQLNTLCARAGY